MRVTKSEIEKIFGRPMDDPNERNSICNYCNNPTECSWGAADEKGVMHWQPVDGWDAEKTIITCWQKMVGEREYGLGKVSTFIVRYCPMFHANQPIHEARIADFAKHIGEVMTKEEFSEALYHGTTLDEVLTYSDFCYIYGEAIEEEWGKRCSERTDCRDQESAGE